MVSIINTLCKKQNISIAELESRLGFGNGAIYKWKVSSPKADNLQKIADYFDVSVDYLLGRKEKTQAIALEPILTDDELNMIEIYRACPEETKIVIKSMFSSLAKQSKITLSNLA